MKVNFASNAAAVNKAFSIRHHQEAIQNASKLLSIPGNDPAYYDWHRRTIDSNKKAIDVILAEPDTNWN
jgi:hypothetical protein